MSASGFRLKLTVLKDGETLTLTLFSALVLELLEVRESEISDYFNADLMQRIHGQKYIILFTVSGGKQADEFLCTEVKKAYRNPAVPNLDHFLQTYIHAQTTTSSMQVTSSPILDIPISMQATFFFHGSHSVYSAGYRLFYAGHFAFPANHSMFDDGHFVFHAGHSKFNAISSCLVVTRSFYARKEALLTFFVLLSSLLPGESDLWRLVIKFGLLFLLQSQCFIATLPIWCDGIKVTKFPDPCRRVCNFFY